MKSKEDGWVFNAVQMYLLVSIKNKYMYLIQMYLEARISTCTHTSYWHAVLHIVISGVFRHENKIVSCWILRLFFPFGFQVLNKKSQSMLHFDLSSYSSFIQHHCHHSLINEVVSFHYVKLFLKKGEKNNSC